MPDLLSSQWLPMFWLILAIVLGVIEAATVQLVAIWVALGALAAIIPAMLNAPLWVQFIVFVLVSAVAIIATRPLVKNVLKLKRTRTNADSVIGKIGVVIVQIDNFNSQGRVSVGGLDWSARSEDSEIIEVDDKVLIKSIDGVKLIVERLL